MKPQQDCSAEEIAERSRKHYARVHVECCPEDIAMRAMKAGLSEDKARELADELCAAADVQPWRRPSIADMVARGVPQDVAEEIDAFPIDAHGNKVYVRVIDEPRVGKVILLAGQQTARQTCRAIVIACGPATGVEGPRGVFKYVEPGDHVMFGTFSGREVTLIVKGQRSCKYAIMSHIDILGTVDPAKEAMPTDYTDEELSQITSESATPSKPLIEASA